MERVIIKPVITLDTSAVRDGSPPRPLADLGAQVLEINRANGWNVLSPEAWPVDPEAEASPGMTVEELGKYQIPARLMARVAKLSGALEAYRKKEPFEDHLRAAKDSISWMIKSGTANFAQDRETLAGNRILASLMLLVSEVAEAFEAHANGDRANFAEELADVQIRLLDTAFGLGIDLDAEVAKKLEKNRGRGFRHGGKLV
jgi:NTP pyrophosphatase (non-canonical NTP hydrolase)